MDVRRPTNPHSGSDLPALRLPSNRRRGTSVALFVVAALAGALSCNRHVFRVVPPDCVKEQQLVRDLAASAPADILVVVDNSGSMCEEQANLVDNFFDPDCPIDVTQPIPEAYLNPTPDVVAQLSQSCGFIQILSLFEKDFRLGVITTDVSQCDNAFGLASIADANCDGTAYADWGRKPQRGCLQATGDGQKVISNADVESGDIGARFSSILSGIRTFGSPFERGLDAVEIFLDDKSQRAPGCEDDLSSFLRPDARLVVIFLTDEEDCSHADGQFGFVDENSRSDCSATTEPYYTQRTPAVSPEACYEQSASLAPVSRYVDALRARKGDNVAVAVIGGGVEGDEGITPAGCRVVGSNPNGTCTPSRGASNATGPGEFCNPERLAQAGLPPCCEADAGSRYFQFARAFGLGNYLENSICYTSFRSTMIEIASFIGREEFVRLAERPFEPEAITVRVRRAGSEEEEILVRIPDGEDPTGRDGWQWDGNVDIYFYGSAVPQPGDRVSVAALDERSDAGAACVPEVGEGSASDPSDGGR